jgi:hypothetical protein
MFLSCVRILCFLPVPSPHCQHNTYVQAIHVLEAIAFMSVAAIAVLVEEECVWRLVNGDLQA